VQARSISLLADLHHENDANLWQSQRLISTYRQGPYPMQLVEPATPVTGLEEAVRILEEEIVLGFLHPRERLVEDDLLERFGLKRHVVRQVLVEL